VLEELAALGHSFPNKREMTISTISRQIPLVREDEDASPPSKDLSTSNREVFTSDIIVKLDKAGCSAAREKGQGRG
jgi:hypothetical protein